MLARTNALAKPRKYESANMTDQQTSVKEPKIGLTVIASEIQEVMLGVTGNRMEFELVIGSFKGASQRMLTG